MWSLEPRGTGTSGESHVAGTVAFDGGEKGRHRKTMTNREGVGSRE